MYSIQKAAELLGRSEATVRKWMKGFGIQVVKVETDRHRVYIADDDMNILVDHVTQQVVSSANKTRAYRKHNRNMIITGEDKYYSFAGAASLLGVSVACVKVWSRQDDIELKLIITDRKRWYRDVLRLADLHNCEVLPSLSSLRIGEELEVLKGKVEKMASDIEDLKHDFRLFMKRSIYVG